MAHFEFSSVIDAPKEEVFDFVSNLSNVPQIMAEDYKIEILSPVTKLKKGSEFDLRIARVGISMVWSIIIEDIEVGEFVRARQNQGPFSLWLHTQKFAKHGQGTLLTDIVEYDVPFGLFGKLADDLFVRRDLNHVFSRRHQKISDTFANKRKKNSTSGPSS